MFKVRVIQKVGEVQFLSFIKKYDKVIKFSLYYHKIVNIRIKIGLKSDFG